MASLRGWRSLADHYGRSTTTVKDWVNAGCPHTMSGKVYLFETGAVDEWRAAREQMHTPDDDDDDAKEEFQRHRTRREKETADKLEMENQIKRGEYAPVADMERALDKVGREVASLIDEYCERVKDAVPEITAARCDQLDKMLVEAKNKIASIKI